MEHERRPPDHDARRWAPVGFRPETTTVWSFPERGAWAGHDGAYRGNWSPSIPRNLLLRYTNPGDLVLDPFVGGGTTAIEAALLGRRCLAGDLAPIALTTTRQHLDRLPRHRRGAVPALVWQDARALAVADGRAALVMLHPPYADAIRYSADRPADLSQLAAGPFLAQLRHVAAESRRVLVPGGRCALLIGDLRRRGDIVPLGFAAIQALRRAGFALEELVIKRQHHTRMEAAWAPVSARRGFLLLAHEYLAVFRRSGDPPVPAEHDRPRADERPEGESHWPPAGTVEAGTTTVWTVPRSHMDAALPDLARQALRRGEHPTAFHFVRTPHGLARADGGASDAEAVLSWLDQVTHRLPPGGILVVETRDVRLAGALHPLGLEVCRTLRRTRGVRLREIIAVVPAADSGPDIAAAAHLAITHRYLVVATRDRAP